MPDGYSGNMGPDWLTRTHFMSEIEQQPNAQQMGSMYAPFGGSPEQAQQLLNSPGLHQALQQFGLGNMQQGIRQSPFFSNQMMQQHPHMMGGLNNAFANAAMTPEAPLVSGAGSGISRAFQGMAGGPEMQRQYQLRQMMAPMQAMGMMMPAQAEQRRWELLKALEGDLGHKQDLAEQNMPGNMMKNNIYAPAGAPGYFTQGADPQHPTFNPYNIQQETDFSKAKAAGQAGIAQGQEQSREKIAGGQNQSREKVAGIGAQSRRDVAGIQSDSRERVAGMQDQTKRDLANQAQDIKQAKSNEDAQKALAQLEAGVQKAVDAGQIKPEEGAQIIQNARKGLGVYAAPKVGNSPGVVNPGAQQQQPQGAPPPPPPGGQARNTGAPPAQGGAPGANTAAVNPGAGQQIRTVPRAQVQAHNPQTGEIRLADGTVLPKGSYNIQ